MPTLKIGFDAQGMGIIKEVVTYLDRVSSSSVSASKNIDKTNAAFGSFVAGSKTAAAALRQLVDVQAQAVSSLSAMAGPASNFGKYSASYKAQVREMVAATNQLGASFAKQRAEMESIASGSGKAAVTLQRYTGATYESIAASQAQTAAVQKLNALHQKYVNTLAEQILAESAGASAITSRITALEKEAAATARVAMARSKLSSGKYQAEINAEVAAYARADAAIAKEIASTERLAAARAKLTAGSIQSGINSFDRVSSGRSKLSAGSIMAEINEYERGQAALSKLDGAYQKAGASGNQFHGFVRGASGAMGKLWLSYGQMGGMLAGFAVAASTIKSIQLGAEFDQITRSTAFLSKNIEGSTASLGDIQRELMGLKDMPYTLKESSSALLEFTRAGKSVEEAFAQIGNGSTVFEELGRFALVAEMNFGDSMKLVINQSNAFGESMQSVANIIAKTADTSTADITTMSEAFKNTTQLGSVLKISFTEVAAALGIMHDKGIQGATAGAALSTSLINISKAASNTKLQKMMQDWNMEFTAFDAGTGKLKELPKLFADLHAATAKLNPEQFTAFMDTIVGKRGMKAAGTLTEEMAKAFDGLTESVGEGSNRMTMYIEALSEATKDGATGMSYLQKSVTAMSESGSYQLKLLQTDIDKLFVASYDNASVVLMLKDLRSVVSDPAIQTGLSMIIGLVSTLISMTAKAIVITVDFAGSALKGAAKGMEDEYTFTPEGGMIGGEYDKLKMYHDEVDKTTAAYNNLQTQMKAGNVEGGEGRLKQLGEERAKAVKTLEQQEQATNGVTKAQIAAGVSNSELRHKMKDTKEITSQSAAAFEAASNNLELMESQAKSVKMTNVEQAMSKVNAAVEKQAKVLAASGLSQEEQTIAVTKYRAATLEAYGPEIQKAKEADARATEKATGAKRVEGEARKAAAAASKVEKEALRELNAEIDLSVTASKQSAEATTKWAEGARKAAEDLGKMYDETETAGMGEADKLVHERNKALEEGAATVARYNSYQSEMADKVDQAAQAHQHAKDELDKYTAALEANKARGGAVDEQAQQKLKDAVKETGVAYKDALAAQILSDAQVQKSKTAYAQLQLELTGTREAYNQLAEAQANDLEKTDSFFNGMLAGAKRLSTEYHTLGKLGAKSFEMITDAADDAARQMSDVLFDHMTGAANEAEEELKATYDENIQNLQESLEQGEVSYEEFEKQRVELTTQYNEEVAAAHRSLWDDITDVVGNIWESLLKSLLQEFIAWVARLAVIWAANNIFNTGFGGSGGNGVGGLFDSLFGNGGGSSDYAGTGTAIMGAGSAMYDWMSDDSVGSGSGSYTDNTSQSWYKDDSGNINYSDNGASGSSTGGMSNYTGVAGIAAEKGYNYVTTGSTAGSTVAAAAPTTFQTGMAGVGAIGGAYGLYSAFSQLANGQANVGTAVQAGTSLYSLYNSYNTLAAAYKAYTAGTAVLSATETTVAVTEGVEAGMASSTTTSAISTGVSEGVATGAAGEVVAAESAAAAEAAAAGAVPVIGWAAAAFMGFKSMAQMVNSHAGETYTSPTLGIPVTMRDYGQDEQNDLKMNQRTKIHTISAWGDALAESGNEGGRGYGESGVYGADQVDFDTKMKEIAEVAMGTLDILANDFGDQLAFMALGLDGTSGSINSFIDAAAGMDVSMEQSAQMYSLAQQAVAGNSNAIYQLQGSLQALGMSEETAQTAMMGLIASANLMASSTNTAAGAVDSMTSSVQSLSSTPLRIAVNVDTSHLMQNYGGYGESGAEYDTTIHRAAAHAFGGIFTNPTMLMSRNGYRHLVGESGSEAILPLRNPNQISNIEDKVAELSSRVASLSVPAPEVNNHFYVDGQQIATKIMPKVDKHIVDKSRRSQLGVRTAW